MTSYITLLSKIEAFCNAHLQIKKYGGEFREQMPNFSTQDEKYPIIFVTPTSDTEDLNTNQFTIDVYCVDIIQKDRANLNTILSDTQLILKDLYVYYKNDNDADLDVIGTAGMTPLNNLDLDYVAGWVMSITFEVSSYGDCVIPMNPIVPGVGCAAATVEITDDFSNVLYTLSVASGSTQTQVISDSTATITNSLGATLHTLSINAEGNATQVIPNSTVTIKDDSNNTLHTVSVTAEGTANQVITDSTVTVKDSANNTLHTVSVNAEGIASQIVADSTYLVEYVNGTPISSGNILAEGSVTVQVPNPSAAISTATLMKTGQTTSYRAGDDGDIEAGRATSFSVLAENNPFGNTNRFTDELGGQTYTNKIYIDWSTYNGSNVLGYNLDPTKVASVVTWNTAIDNSLATSIGIFTSGWRLINVSEYNNLRNYGVASYRLNYSPINLQVFNTAFIIWTSTTFIGNTAQAFGGPMNSEISIQNKINSSPFGYIPVRTFTVTGTTLS